jgi:hypothetical protein
MPRQRRVLNPAECPTYNCAGLEVRDIRGPALEEVMAMGHAIRIQSKEQYIAAVRVLDKLPGWWHARGPSTAPVLLLTDDQYNALVEAGVIPAKDKEVKVRGKKAPSKKITS